MEDKAPISNGHEEMQLASPAGLPFGFTILIREGNATEDGACTFEVTAYDRQTLPKTCFYQMPDRQHQSYIELFANLSADFGLRLPQNRHPPVKHDFRGALRELLTENLVPEMLYGYGDPAVLRVEDDNKPMYYLVVTSNDAPNAFPICRSPNLADWEFVNFVFPSGNKPEWAADGKFVSDYWAPEMHRFDNEFRVYFVARDKNTFELCIGVARSVRPEGPFLADRESILKGDVIDPHVFVEDDSAFLYWKEDNNAVWPGRLIDLLYKNPRLTTDLFVEEKDQLTASLIITLWPWMQTLGAMERFLVGQILIEAVTFAFSSFESRLSGLMEHGPPDLKKDIRHVLDVFKTPVYAQKLSPNGSSLTGDHKKIIENDLAWEAHLVEGTWVTKHDGKYYLFYSGNDFSTYQYGVGVAVAASPLGPYRKLPEQLLRSTEEWWAPGHPSLAIGPDGKPQLFLHAFFPGKAGYKEFRALLTAALKFEDDRVLLE